MYTEPKKRFPKKQTVNLQEALYMERMTRLSALLLAGVLSVGTLAGCSRQAPSDAGASAASESPAAAETPAPAETPAASERGTASSGAEGDAAAAGGNVLVVYFSASGHTEAVAQTIAEATAATCSRSPRPSRIPMTTWTGPTRTAVSARSMPTNRCGMWNWPPPRRTTGTVMTPSLSAIPSGGASRPGRLPALWRPTISPAKR